MNPDKLLYDIDKRLAVLEVLTNEHSKLAIKEFGEIKKELVSMQTDLVRLRIRVAGMAAVVSLFVTGVVQFLSSQVFH